MNFTAFKSCDPARVIFHRLGLIDLLEDSDGWRTLRRKVLDFNDRTGELAQRAQAISTFSSGERVVFRAILFSMDFAHLADSLDNGRTWQNMGIVSGEFRQALAACIALED